MSDSSKLKSDVLAFAFHRKPEPAEAIDICAGIQWFRVPLPFALDHVNCWLLGEPGDQVLIDTGVNNPDTRELWVKALSGAAGSHAGSLREISPENLLITHFHPDHMGLAGEMAGDGLLAGSAVEVDLAHRLYAVDDQSYAQLHADWYRSHGLPEETVNTVLANGNTYSNKVTRPPEPERWSFLVDEQLVSLAGQDYTVLIGRGHAPDMIMLYRESDHVLIAADQVLPRISPNVSIMPLLDDMNPLQSFLDTLKRLRALPADTLVLPSHGIPFRGLHERIDELLQHHEMRLSQVVDACAEPRSAHDLFQILFNRSMDPQQTSFALGESLSHLHFLELAGQLTRIEQGDQTQFVIC